MTVASLVKRGMCIERNAGVDGAAAQCCSLDTLSLAGAEGINSAEENGIDNLMESGRSFSAADVKIANGARGAEGVKAADDVKVPEELQALYELQITCAAHTLLVSDIGATVRPSVRKGRGIPLRYLARNCEVAWEKKIDGGRRIRGKSIGDCKYDDLSDFESARGLSKHEIALVTFVDDSDEMRLLVKE